MSKPILYLGSAWPSSWSVVGWMAFVSAQTESPRMREWRARAAAQADEVGREVVLQYP
jgi:hypothetical protein